MSRETRRAADLTEDTCVFLNYDRGEQVRVVMSAYTVNGKTTVVFNDGEPIRVGSNVPFNLATQQEVEEADAQADRTAFAACLDRFADRVVQARLPVPHRDQRIHIGFDLDRVQDVQAWMRWLSANPQQGTSRLVVLAEVEGVELMVRGPEGSTGEFGPELADPTAHYESGGHCTCGKAWPCPDDTVEHRDSVGAFPIVPASMRRVSDFDAGPELAERGERDGWSVSDGHRPPVDEDAMQHDRHSGEG